MRVEKKDNDNSTVTLDVEIDWDEISGDFDSYVAHFKKDLAVPGFRKGKMPTNDVLRRYGKELESEFTEHLLHVFYPKAVEEAGVNPIEFGKVESMQFSYGQNFTFSVNLEVEPDFDIFDYTKKKLAVTKRIVEIGEEEVNQALLELQERYAEVRELSTGAETGNILEVDIQELDETLIPIVGRKVESRLVKLGEGNFGTQAAEQLKDSKPGDERIVRITNDHGDHTHEMSYRFTVKKVEEHLLPELTDEFAAKVHESFKTVSDLKKAVEKDMRARLDRDSEEALGRALAEEMVRYTEINVPEPMINSYLDRLIEGMRSEDNSDVDEDFLRKNYRAAAVWQAKWLMIRRAIARRENISVTDSEIDEIIEKSVKLMGGDKKAADEMRKNHERRRDVRQDLLENRIIQVLRSNADIKEERVLMSELRNTGAPTVI